MNRQQMHNIVEYIKTQPEFPFDALDVEESVEEVLSYFGLHPEIDSLERDELRADLLRLAIEAELAEMARAVEIGPDLVLDLIGEKLHPGITSRRNRSSVYTQRPIDNVHLI